MKLYRKRKGAVIGGVCIGIADKYNIDPLLIRISVLILIFFTGGLLGSVYLIFWTILPSLDSNTTIKEELVDKIQELKLVVNKVGKPLFLGGLSVFLGIFALFIFIFPFDIIYKVFIPLILIGIGLYFFIRHR